MDKTWTPEDVNASLSCATGMLGPMDGSCKERILRYFRDPRFETWDDVCGIIVRGEHPMLTLWQAVLVADPTFPRRGRCRDLLGNMLEEWERIPEPHVVAEALFWATR